MSEVDSIRVGSAVIALAGREKGRCFVAAAIDGGFVYLADGRKRKLASPKRKNIKHISPAGAEIKTEGLTDKRLRKFLSELRTQGSAKNDHRCKDE